ncbi:MAG: trehalose-phosphatase [Candidatus Omnitrophica bacterium]|nr:trehalose-phosphatase [Candidatus Omnitrophota bacterium]
MKYFFNIWSEFSRRIERGRKLVLLFDLDGTLTPIIGNPNRTVLSQKVRSEIKKLARKENLYMGIVSGRGIKDVMRLVGIRGIYYAGNHGLEIEGPRHSFSHPSYKKFGPFMQMIARTLAEKIEGIKGAILEDKKHSLSLHYRLVDQKYIQKVIAVFQAVCRPYLKSGKIRITRGKKVFEARPPVQWDKGKAVKAIKKMMNAGGALTLFIGDDITDEDAFKVLRKKDYSIRVSKKKGSRAKYYLKNTEDVRRLLMRLNKILVALFIVFTLSIGLLQAGSFAQEAGDAVQPVVVAGETAQPAAVSSETEVTAPDTAETEEKKPLTLPGSGLITNTIGQIGNIINPHETDDVDMKVYETKTEDGWTIAIDRYHLKATDKYKGAVILCHGFNFNSLFWNLDRRCSPAHYLASNGYDVYVPSLRGSGGSSKPLLSRFRSMARFDIKDVPQMFVKAPFDLAKFGWTIDDHIHMDLPAIIDFVKKKSGFGKVFWIGHSMGGIVMYGYLETEEQDDIAGFIPVGSMIIIPDPLTPHLRRIASQKPILTASLIVNTTVASQVRNYTLGAVKNPIEELLFERDNMYNDVVFRLFREAIDDTSAGVVGQFSDSIKRGAFLSADLTHNYTEDLSKITVPILIIGGSNDGFVTKKVLRDSYDIVSSKDKSIFIFSKGYGFSTNYGHCDVLLGKNAEVEVYPVILSWLDKRSLK